MSLNVNGKSSKFFNIFVVPVSRRTCNSNHELAVLLAATIGIGIIKGDDGGTVLYRDCFGRGFPTSEPSR